MLRIAQDFSQFDRGEAPAMTGMTGEHFTVDPGFFPLKMRSSKFLNVFGIFENFGNFGHLQVSIIFAGLVWMFDDAGLDMFGSF